MISVGSLTHCCNRLSEARYRWECWFLSGTDGCLFWEEDVGSWRPWWVLWISQCAHFCWRFPENMCQSVSETLVSFHSHLRRVTQQRNVIVTYLYRFRHFMTWSLMNVKYCCFHIYLKYIYFMHGSFLTAQHKLNVLHLCKKYYYYYYH